MYTFFQKLGIVHCDLKLNNLMLPVASKKLSKVKIIDFGLSKKVGNLPHVGKYGLECYMAPETVLELPIGPPIDMWALGCLAYELSLRTFLVDPYDHHQVVSISKYI